MIALTVQEMADLVGGSLDSVSDPGQLITAAAVIDSREVEPGGLFAAVPGERVDGHDFAAQAVCAGAVVALAQRPVGAPAVIVPDTVQALGVLSRQVLARVADQVCVVALTGSVGKTSTKDLVSQVLEQAGPTVAPVGSFNNEIGLPLTALKVTDRTQFLVLEMGARGPGHIAYLAGLAPPRVGLVLNVGSAHMGEFGGLEQTAQAKGELVESLPDAGAGGVAVLNADDPLVSRMAARTSAKVVTFGFGPEADVRAEQAGDDAGCPVFTLRIGDDSAPVALDLVGRHHIANALAAAAVAHALGMQTHSIAAALSQARRLSPGRMEMLERADGVTIVNDAYNANPDSVLAAFRAVGAFAGNRRKVLVLGEMAELGPDSLAEHTRMGAEAVKHGMQLIIGFGGGPAEAMLGGAGHGHLVRAIPDAVEFLEAELRSGDVVLVKASKSVGLQALARTLASC